MLIRSFCNGTNIECDKDHLFTISTSKSTFNIRKGNNTLKT